MSSTPSEPCSLTHGDLNDLLMAFVAGELSEGLLRDILGHTLGLTGDQTRALWYDSVQRGCRWADRFVSARPGPPAADTSDPPGSSPSPSPE
jgi:hypothetical protein